jgi:8-oxo-dGTP pyrophosphatase MutT (NUDIX family)
VTSFLEHDGKILVLRRSERVRTYRCRWAGVSGSIDGGRTPEQQARLEILEETTLTDDDVGLVAAGAPLAIDDPTEGRRWLVYPFRFQVLHPEKIKTDWEHVETRWIAPETLADLETVPRLADAWAAVTG